LPFGGHVFFWPLHYFWPLHLHRRREPVAALGEGFDVDRLRGRVSQGLAQLVDSLVQALLIIHERAVGPQAPLEFLARNNPTRLFEQGGQDLDRLLLQFQADAVFG
jgi:hypothetical protein